MKISGAVVAVIGREFGISQPAVSQHLRVLRENGFATVRAAGTRRLYSVDSAPLREVDDWLQRFRRFWSQQLTRWPPSWPGASASAAGSPSGTHPPTTPAHPERTTRDRHR